MMLRSVSVCLVLMALSSPSAGKVRVRTSDVRRAKVVHVTTVTLRRRTDVLRVFHAKPVHPAWAGGVSQAFMTKVKVTPPSGKLEQTVPRGDGDCWRWERRSLRPGRYTFRSEFVVVTAKRDLGSRDLSWPELSASARRVTTKPVDELKVPKGLAERAKSIKRQHKNPTRAIEEFSRYVNAEIKYDTSVRYSPSDLDAIVRGKKGWCGHRATVFRAMCQATGIPVRPAQGFMLNNRDGLWNGHEDWNRHGWAEVHLPGAGWVEVEPAARKAPFMIRHEYLRNPVDLQSQSVFVQNDGKWQGHADYTDTIRATWLKR